MSENTYSIVRFHSHRPNEEDRRTGLTLEEAQEHCKDPETTTRPARPTLASGSTATAKSRPQKPGLTRRVFSF